MGAAGQQGNDGSCRDLLDQQTEQLQGGGAGQAHLKREWVSLYGDRVLCNQNPFVPRGCTLWVCSQRHRFRTILPR